MTTVERLYNWKQSGIISATQREMLTALVRKERFSLFLELNALLYIGVLLLVGGLAWTFKTHFERLGDVFILVVLSTLFAASVYYCLSRAPFYANQEVESPNFVFDYVVYLACLLLSVEIGYIEFRYEWLQDTWHNYLLFSSTVFLFFAYRFDNRFVLSLALSSLAGWFGVEVSKFGFSSSEPVRLSGLVYAVVIALVGTFMFRQGIKRHFLETYLHIAANVFFIASISGLFGDQMLLYLTMLLLVSAGCLVLGIRFKKFVFAVYGIVFGYIGISVKLVQIINDFPGILVYLVLTGSGVIVLVVSLARRVGREE